MTALAAQPEPIYLNPEAVARAVGGKARGNRVTCHAPGHKKGAAEISILIDPSAPRGMLVNCFSGEDPVAMKDWVLARCGEPDFSPGAGTDRPQSTAHIRLVKKAERPKPFTDQHLLSRGYSLDQTYEYVTADGEVVFEVLRYRHETEPKTFIQRRPDEHGGWYAGRGEAVIYRLPEILANATDPIFVTEGEKDSDRLASLGFLATTVPNGSWPEDLSALNGRKVYVLADNDSAGDKKAAVAVERLQGIATVARIDLPDLPPKGDVSDWLDAGHTAEDLVALCKEATPVAANDNTPPALSIFEWTVDRFKGEAPAVRYLVDGVSLGNGRHG